MGLNEDLGDRENVGNASLAAARGRDRVLNLNYDTNNHYQGETVIMVTTAEPVTKPPSTRSSSSSSTTVSLSLDAETFAYFETKAAEDDRTVSKFIARTLKAYVAEKTKKQTEDKNF